jgi:DNA transformation protein
LNDTAFLAHLRELLGPVGRFGTRAMFGGHGIYLDDLIVGIVADGALFLKVDEETRARFEAAGCAPFVYSGKGRTITMSYWSVPEDALDTPDAMAPWARLAVAAALRAAARKPASPKRAAPRKPTR